MISRARLARRRDRAYDRRMRLRALLPGLLIATACGRGDGPTRAPTHNQPEERVPSKPTELVPLERWRGPIDLPNDEPVTAIAIRDQAAYDALIARLPPERIQMKQPAPPSDDPLLKRPPIDFTTHMLVVVTRGDTLTPPTLARVIDEPDRVVVRYVAPGPPPEARPHGVGGYVAVKVPRAEGPIELVGPRLIEDPAALPAAVGDLVTLSGALEPSKIPTLLGVDVDPDSEVGDAKVEASGWLESTVVTQQQIDDEVKANGQFATRGPGTFYSLRAIDGPGLARAERAW
jgi:hypothetical protein